MKVNMVLISVLILFIFLISGCTGQDSSNLNTQPSSVIDACYDEWGNKNPLGVIGCLDGKVKEYDNPTICNQLGTLSNYKLDKIATSTYYENSYYACTMLSGFDTQSADECFDEERQNFVDEYTKFCKKKYADEGKSLDYHSCENLDLETDDFYNCMQRVAMRRDELDIFCSAVPKDSINPRGNLYWEDCYISLAITKSNASVCDNLGDERIQECIDAVEEYGKK